MRLRSILLSTIVLGLLMSALPASASAQFTPPSGPVLFCFTQAPPEPASWQTVTDNGTAAPMTPTAPAVAACPSAATHSFTLPAAPFTIGTHTVMIRTINSFGPTNGPVYTVVVGIAPGAGTIIAVIPPPAE